MNLTLAAAPTTAAVPAINGATFEAYSAAVTAAGLVPQRAQQDAYSDSVASGAVISTSPAPTTVVQKNSTVTITVSKGKQPAPQTTVPAFTQGSTQYQAYVDALTAAGLKANKVDLVDGSKPAGTVSQTDPAAGSKVDNGTTVNVTVFKTP